MEVFGMFGFVLGLLACMLAGFAISESSQLRKEVRALTERLPEPPPVK